MDKPPVERVVRVQIVDIDIPFSSLAWLVFKLVPAIAFAGAMLAVVGSIGWGIVTSLASLFQ